MFIAVVITVLIAMLSWQTYESDDSSYEGVQVAAVSSHDGLLLGQ